MATTEERLNKPDELEELYRNSPDTEPRRPASLEDWSRRLLIGWLAVFGSIMLFEPAPTNADLAIPVWANVLLTTFTVALAAGIVGLSLRRPWGVRTSLLAGGLGVVIGGACVVTDHHTTFWGMYEIVAFSGLTAASWVATKSRTTTPN